MPNEPRFPPIPDIMSAIAGLGRKGAGMFPDTPLPKTPLQPYFGPYTPDITPRQIAEMFLPQSMLDVGLMAIPGSKTGRPFARRAVEYGEAKLVPALREIATGKEHIGKLGTDVWHEGLAKRLGIDTSKLRSGYEQGFVNSETGEWLDFAKAAKTAEMGMATRATRPNITTMPKEAPREADVLASKAAIKREPKPLPEDLRNSILKNMKNKGPLVPAIGMEDGRVLPGKLGEHFTHNDVDAYYRAQGVGGRVVEDGFINTNNGEWVSKKQLETTRGKWFRVSPLDYQVMKEADVLAAKAAPKKTLQELYPGLPEGKDPVVPAIYDKGTGKWFSGIPGVDFMHGQLTQTLVEGEPLIRRPTRDGFKNLRTGEYFTSAKEQPGDKYWRVPPMEDF